MSASRYTFDSNSIAAKVIESEVIMIDLESGTYFSIEGSASLAWQCLVAGISVGETVDRLSNFYGLDGASISQHVKDFVEKLVQENILQLDSSSAPEAKEDFDLSYPPETSYTPPDMIVLRDVKNLMDMRLEPLAPIVG